MKLSFGTVAPTAVILVAALGLLYSYFGAPPGPDQPKGTSLEVTEAMLNPALVALPARDPFRLSPEYESKLVNTASIAPYSPTAAAPGPIAPGEPERGPPDPKRPARVAKATPAQALNTLTSRLRGWADAIKKRADMALAIRADLKAKVEGKANLSCISIHSRRKIAIINGRAYAEGEAIEWAVGLAGPIFVAEVRAASVLLRSRGAEHEVGFPHSSKPTAAMASVGPNSGVAKKSKAARKAAGGAAARAR